MVLKTSRAQPRKLEPAIVDTPPVREDHKVWVERLAVPADQFGLLQKKGETVSFDAKEEIWRELIARAPAPDRAELCLSLFAKNLQLGKELLLDAAILVWASAARRHGEESEGLVTPVQGMRALQKLGELEPATREAADVLLRGTSSIAERAVLLKGLAARYTVEDGRQIIADLTQLASLIRGQDFDWLAEHTTAYGVDKRIGTIQYDEDGCGVTVRLVAEAEIDPLVALSITLDELGQGNAQSFGVRNQRYSLEAAGGKAVPRELFDRKRLKEVYGPGRGTELSAYIQTAFDGLGVRYNHFTWADANDKPQLLDAFETCLRAGYDLPLRSKRDTFLAKEHAEILVDCKRQGTMRSWRIHDPWTGDTRWVSDRALLQGDPKDDNWRLIAVYVPF